MRRQRFFVYVCLSSICCLLILYVLNQQEYTFSSQIHHGWIPNLVVKNETNSSTEFTINQPGCRIPSFPVFGPLVAPFYKSVPAVRCELGRLTPRDTRNRTVPVPAIVFDDATSLMINRSSYTMYNKTKVLCSYRSFQRPAPSNSSANDANIENVVIFSRDVKELSDVKPTTITDMETNEFIRVTCEDASMPKKVSEKREPFYRDYFAFVPRKKLVEERCERIDRALPTERRRLNVMVIGMDALSRLNFQRQMPSSYKYLINKMAAIEMHGYNKVADNSYKNLMPVLSGLSETELADRCHKSGYDVFDNCSFIWDFFEHNGYRTVYAEDAPESMLFHYLNMGFRRQPTDYYLRPFYLQAENDIGFHKFLVSHACLGSRLSFSTILNYAYKHAAAWKTLERFFGFFWTTSLTHDFLNVPADGDTSLLEFLNRYGQTRAANNTILILLSDHGFRMGPFCRSVQGTFEVSLPVLMYVLPRWFERKYPRAVANLRLNQHRLTTPFDLHDTFFDLADLERSVNDNAIVGREKKLVPYRSQSLFLPIPIDRTCRDCGISDGYCSCRETVQKLSVNDSRAIVAAKVIVTHINDLLKDKPECAQLTLDRLDQVTEEKSTEGAGLFTQKDNIGAHSSLLRVTVVLEPSGGLFEGSLRYSENTKNYELLGQVNRINIYGTQSWCVDDPTLRLYCYCLT